MSDEIKIIEVEVSENLICPHCGYEDKDSWEYKESLVEEETTCENCGKKFSYTQEFSRTFTSFCRDAEKKENGK